MVWEVSPARSAFPVFAAEWDRLNREFYGGHPMFDSRFIGALLECFAEGDEQLCIHRHMTVADGALILTPRGYGRWGLFLPAQAQTGALLLRDARLLETIFVALPGLPWSIELVALDPHYSPGWSHLSLPRSVQQHDLTMSVDIHNTVFQAYWDTRPKSLAKNLRRYQRRAEENFGSVSFAAIIESHEMRSALIRYGELEMAGWKGMEGTAVSIDNEQGRFYEEVLRQFAASGQAMVFELHVGGKLASSRLIVRNEHMWIILKVAYAESLAAVAPGRLLLYETIKQAHLEPRPESIEFYTNASREQAEWATSLRYIRHHQLYRGQLSAIAHCLGQQLRASIRRGRDKESTDKESGRGRQRFRPLIVKRYASPQEFTSATVQFFDEFSDQNIEFSLGWFDNLQHTVFPDDPGVRYYIAEVATKPVVALPLRLVRDGLIRRVESLGNFYTSRYEPIRSADSTSLDLLPILKAATGDHHGPHVMRFGPMDPESANYEALLTALRSCGWIPFSYFCFGNWFLKVDKPWAEYLQERKSTLRNTIRRMNKKFASAGGILEIVTDPVLAESAIQAYNHVYAASWKKPEPYEAFIPALVRWLAAKGALRLGIARLADRPIAAQIWTVYHGKAHIFKIAYDEAFANFSSGTLLTALLMEHVIERDGVREVDYLIGDDLYKQSWMSHRRERWGIIAYNPRTVIGLVLTIREIAGRTLRRIFKMIRS